MSAIELVVTDLDGTLWGSDEVVHARTLEALTTLESRRVPVLVATGRRLRSAAGTLARSGLELPALVVLDGALGRDVVGDRVFHQAAFAPEDAGAVLETFHDAGLSPCMYVDRSDAEVLVGPAPSTNPRHTEAVGRWLREDDLARAAETEPVLMFAIVGGDAETLRAVAAEIDPAAAAGAVTRDIIVGGATITVRPPGISKWQGVLAWCADQDLDPGRVLAVGDGQNDVELLESARVACVVADGCDEALTLADHVIEPASAGGWSAICELV